MIKAYYRAFAVQMAVKAISQDIKHAKRYPQVSGELSESKTNGKTLPSGKTVPLL